MADWNPRSPIEWAQSLGMVRVPMFDHSRASKYRGEHAVILDGKTGSFSLSVGNAQSLLDLDKGIVVDGGPLTWSWSANVRHSVIVDAEKDVLLVRRWDDPDDIQDHPFPVNGEIRPFFERLIASTPPEPPSVIDRCLRAFRFVRNGIVSQGGTDLDAMRAFNCLLIWSECVKHGVRDLPSGDDVNLGKAIDWLSGHGLIGYGAADFTNPALLYPFGVAVDILLTGEGRANYVLDADLLIRHASGKLFQEAHIEIEHPTVVQPSFWPLSEGERRKTGTPKRDAHFTPPSLARLLVEQSIDEIVRVNGGLPQKLHILDPACGQGVFLIETARECDGRIPNMVLRGIDNAPLSCVMSEFCLLQTLKGLSVQNWLFQVAEKDSLQMLSWSDQADGDPDIILMNPPFRSWEAMSPVQQQLTKDILGDWYHGRPDSALAFLVKGIKSLKQGAVLAAVLPAGALESDAAQKMREAINTDPNLTIRFIGRFRGNYFEDAMVEAAFIVISRSQRAGLEKMRLLYADRGREESAIRAVRYSEWDQNVEGVNFEVFSRASSLAEEQSWMPRPQRGDLLLERLYRSANIRRVDAIFETYAGVKIGLKKALLIPFGKLNEYAPTKSEQRFFRPVADAIRNAQAIADHYVFYPYDANGNLAITTEADLRASVPVFYRKQLVHHQGPLLKRASLRNRQWWELVEPRPTWQPKIKPKIVTQAFGVRGSFALDETGALVVVQGVAWLPRTSYFEKPEWLWAYIAVVNSEIFERLLRHLCKRVEGREHGWYELYPKFIDQMPIPDWSAAKKDVVSKLAKIGRRMGHGQQPPQGELGTAVCKAYGVSEIEFARSIPLNDEEWLQVRFDEYASRWKKETKFQSSMAQMAKHPAYKKILEFGPEVVPLILANMQHRTSYWFPALQYLTGENPVPREKRGFVDEMRKAWLQWGRENSYVEAPENR